MKANKLSLPLVVERNRVSKEADLTLQDMTLEYPATIKLRKEDEERLKKEQEQEEMLKYGHLGQSVLERFGAQKSAFRGSNRAVRSPNVSPNDSSVPLMPGASRKKATFNDRHNKQDKHKKSSKLHVYKQKVEREQDGYDDF